MLNRCPSRGVIHLGSHTFERCRLTYTTDKAQMTGCHWADLAQKDFLALQGDSIHWQRIGMTGYSSAEFCLRRVKSGIGYPAMPATP